MSTYVLKKGTIVGHGTSLSRLPSILDQGLLCKAERAEGRMTTELAPETSGVYVGELMAYFGAYAQYSSEVAPILNHPEVFKAVMHFAQDDMRGVRMADLPIAPRTFPIVLKIRLEEDCELVADEDFVADGKFPVGQKVPETLLRQEAQAIWERWATGAILRDIPPSWIISIEHPRVLTLDNVKQAAKQILVDCELIAGALMQSYKRVERTELISAFVQRHGKLAFSQNMPATVREMKRLHGMNGFVDNTHCFANHFMLFQTIDFFSYQYQIPVARDLGDTVVLDRNGYTG